MINRRDFIKTSARGVILGGLGLMSGVLLLREKGTEVCNFEFVCGNCNKLKACNLPEANDYRKKK